MSDDGAYALVLIALLGNPFSPAYARARARGTARALDFCALHVALHGPRRSSWSLCERSIHESARRPREIALGRSHIAFDRGALAFDIHENTTLLPGAVRGRVTLHPEHAQIGGAAPVALDAAGDHRWWPVAPLSRVEVDLQSPDLRFRGYGYHDANAGTVPIDESFRGWTWSRARVGERVAVAYDVVESSGEEHARGMVFGTPGTTSLDRTWRAPLPSTFWRLARSVAADEGHAARDIRSLTDSPFYARSLVRTRLLGRETVAVHETLSADRLRSSWVRFLLGFRMTRRD